MKLSNIKVLTSVALSCIILINGIIPTFASNTTDNIVDFEYTDTIEINSIVDETDRANQSTSDEVYDLDLSYSTNSVIIQLTNEASLQLKNYSIEDFDEIDAKNIEDLTEYSTEKIREQRDNNIDVDTNNVQSVSESSFNQMLEIELNTDSEDDILRTIDELNNRDDVLFAQPNYIYVCTAVPNDTCKNDQYAIEKMELTDAWNLSTGDSSFKVGVIDTGINKNNPDIVNNYDNELSKSFINYPADVSGRDEHGTHVAGIIGAQGNNSKGIAGVCWNVTLVSLRIADDNGYSNTANAIKAIQYAKEHNIKLLNYCNNGTDYDAALKNAIKNYNGLFICSAGNDSKDLETDFNSYPPEFHLGNIISVASCDYFDFLTEDSNYGANTVDLAAPGDNILSTYKNTYDYKSGTSMAAPQVTGIAALIWSKYPELSVAEVKAAILNNVDEVEWLRGKVKTNGRVNAFRALSSIENKKFTVKFYGNGGIGCMDDLVVMYGKTTPLSENRFIRKGYSFCGWYAHREQDNKWIYTNGKKQGWYVENTQPDGYYKAMYNNKAGIAKTSPFDNDIVTMYAQWSLVCDVDLDGRLSIKDATSIQKYLAGYIIFTDEQKLAADVNSDKVINIIDATEIQKILVE